MTSDNNEYCMDFFAPRNTNQPEIRCRTCHWFTGNKEAGNWWASNCQHDYGLPWNEAEDFCSKWEAKK